MLTSWCTVTPVSPSVPGRAQDAQQAVVAVLQRMLPLLHRGRQAALVGHDPHLDELDGIRLGAVALGVERARAERHALDGAGVQQAAVAQTVRVAKVAGRDVRDAFDVAVGVHRPVRAGHQRIVVEDAQRADAHVLRVVILVEAEVPAGAEPAAIGGVDLAIAADLERSEGGGGSRTGHRPHYAAWSAVSATLGGETASS
jgi:hypothetical protein